MQSSDNLAEMRVLHVEAEETTQNILRETLRRVGVRKLDAVKTSEEAKKLLVRNKYDFSFIEYRTASEDGLKLIEHIRNPKMPLNAAHHIVLTAGDANLGLIKSARDTGASTFLAKPFSIGAVKNCIAYLLTNPREFIDIETYYGPDRRVKVNYFDGDDKRTLEPNKTENSEAEAS